ncbi:hypothetical protein [Aquipuribacter sp. MA13-6]|uniref:primosomal protein N' family DNA-binding protein n=1 Tax=unclassified Aquipuribacter TaxID=2635084 RepID=UPI003EECD114
MSSGPAQPALFGPAPRRRGAARSPSPASEGGGPVAAVVVDVPLAHLDHPFSYAVPAALVDQLHPGARVVVPFAGRTEDGWVLDVADGDVAGLRPVRRVVTPHPPLTREVAALARAVADATGGTLADVLRSAVPPRHAAAERVLLADDAPAGDAPADDASADEAVDRSDDVGAGDPRTSEEDPGPWASCVAGPAFLQHTRSGEGPRAAVRLPLDADPWSAVTPAVRAALASGRDAVVVLPDVVAVEACAAVLTAALGTGQPVVALHHGLGPAARWRAFLRLRLGRARVVVGTRSAVFAPVRDPGLVLVWDDGDDGHVEPHAPGWDSGLAALLRAEASGAALALVSHARSVRTQWWVRTGRVKDVAPDRATRRRAAPRVDVPDPADPLEIHARVPRAAHRAAAEALRTGPVLVSVPRTGWATALQCRRCRHAVRCRRCSGPLAVVGAAGELACRWCTRSDDAWACPECTGTQVRAGVVGATRSAEELGRAFPGVPVTLSRGGHRSDPVPGTPRLVVATPGTEPPAAGGYTAALVLDGDLALARRGLAVEEETLRRWLAVAALVRPAADGGRLVVVADPAHRVVQALVQDAPEALAGRLCDERAEVGLPPARTVARLLGDEHALSDVAADLRGESTLLPDPVAPAVGAGPRPTVLGPAPTEDGERWQLLLTGPADVVVGAVKDLLATRSAAKAPGRLVVRVDPHDLD